MDHAALVLGGWIVAVGGFAGYAAAVVVRGRALTKRVPAERRRWSDS